MEHISNKSDALDWFESMTFALAIVIFVFMFCVRIILVSGASMNNTLIDKDRVAVQSFMYKPNRGDVVVVDGYTEYKVPIVKRIIAKGNDEVFIDEDTGKVYVNQELIDEPYAIGATHTGAYLDFPVKVPNGMVFVMGDNRENSSDSRSADIGFINERDIIGRVLLRILPLREAALIN